MAISIHPKIISAIKTGLLMDDARIHEIIQVGQAIFVSQEFLNRVSQDYTQVHLKAALDFIEKFLGNYEHAESQTLPGREIRLSYFQISQGGREGYCLACSPKEVVLSRITSLDGMPVHRRIFRSGTE